MTTRDPRRSSMVRGIFIAVLLAGYGWAFHQPDASLTQTFLIGAAVQLSLIALKRFVPSENLPDAMEIFELVADGVTVLLFALGVYGGIVRMPDGI